MKKTSQVQPLSPVAHSSMHSEKDISAQKLRSFEELRSDGCIQAEVQRQFHQYDRTSRTSNPTKGKAVDFNLKSGRFCQGYIRCTKHLTGHMIFVQS